VVAQQLTQYPSKPIRIVIPFAVGGGSDTLTRLLQPKLRDELGQVIIIDNRPGAGTIIGTEVVARSAPDGHTLLITLDQTMTMNPALYSSLPYDPFKNFAPVSMMARADLIYAINPQVPARTMKDFSADTAPRAS
jgi:tripartite-type tricarboxylate transporter receptor subunit TctC